MSLFANGRLRRPVGFRDHLVGFLLAAAYIAILIATTDNLGYARDEGFYFRASETYAKWFELLWENPKAAIQKSEVDTYWKANNEHPALVKSVFALTWTIFYKKLGWFTEEGTSFRFGGMLFAGGALWLLYIWGARARSRTVGLVAALSFALMPRIFYHSHLDCFDVPIATMWLLAAYAYWRSLEQANLRWALFAAFTFGLALNTKHNSWFIPFAVIAHLAISRGPRFVRDIRARRFPLPLSPFAMALIGPLVFVGGWPWLWFDTAQRFTNYVRFHTNHDYYNIVFLGQTYWKPPFPLSWAPVMTLATVPTILLLLFAIGFLARGWDRLGFIVSSKAARPLPDATSTDLLWALGIAVAYAPWLSSSTPIFGGTKHWITAYPFMCLFAGCGFEVVAKQLRTAFVGKLPSIVPSRAIDWVAGILVLSAPFAETAGSHPWGLSNYTPLVGGAPGAASLGLNRQFWGFTTGAVTDWLNENVPRGGRVYIHDTAWDSWRMLQRDGRLPSHLRAVFQPHAAAVSLYHHEEHMQHVEYQMWIAYGTTSPAHIGVYHGVPIIYVYAQPDLAPNRPGG